MAQGPLASPRFQHPRLQQAAQDKRYPIKLEEKGYPVAAIQYTLHQMGIALPRSMRGGVPDGSFGDETRRALFNLQGAKKLGNPDGKAGPITLAYLDAEVLAMPDRGGPIPGGWQPGGAAPISPGAGGPPPGYETMPPSLHKTLRRSYDEKTPDNFNLADAMGFPPGAHTAASKTFKEVLDTLKAQGRLAVIEAVHARCLKEPALWEKIHAIRWVWTYSQGGGVSQGFAWTSKDSDGALRVLKGSASFCEDVFPMNADHQKDLKGRLCLRRTFREIIGASGEGLHACVVVPAYRAQDAWGGEHDIHIDLHQIVCKKYHAMPGVALQAPDGACIYLDLVQHARDAIPYFLKKFGIEAKLDSILGGLSAMAQTGGGLTAVTPSQVAGLFTQALPLMPQPVAMQAAEWLIQTMKTLAAQKIF